MNDIKLSWYNVSLRQFLKLQELLEIEDEGEKVLAISELLLGNEVSDLTLMEFNKKAKQLEFLKEPLPSKNPLKKFEVNGRKYYMDCLLGNITTAQYVDYINHSKESDICKMMSVFCIPEGHKYNDGYDMLQVFEDIMDLPIPIVNDAAFFFDRQFQEFIRIFLRYSMKKIKRMKISKEMKKELMKVFQDSMDLASFL